jgi:Tfp pilus assembly protein PilV
MTLRKKIGLLLAGFTLVELLVSVAVLVMLILLISQLVNSATMTTTLNQTHINADEAARLVFDRMGSDLVSMVRRPDVNYVFYKNGASASDAMFFYSESPGYLDQAASSTMATTTGSASSMSLVGYRVNQSNSYYSGIPVLERLGENLTWAGTPDSTGVYPGGPVFLPFTLAGNWAYTIGTPPYNSQNDTTHYQVLSDMVFRMEFCFLVKSGTYALSGTTVATATTGYSNAPTAIPATVPHPYVTTNYFSGGSATELPGNVYGFPPDLGAIVVTIAVLDTASRKIVPSGKLAALASVLSDSLSGNSSLASLPQGNPPPTAQAWQDQLLPNGPAQSVGIPQAALRQVRVYERTFYLDAN